MAKPPNKAKTAAPMQFDMNSRDRKGGKGGPHGSGRGRDEKRAPSRIVSLPPTLVDRGEGWIIRKIGKVDQTSRSAVGAEYEVIFEGHDPLVFNYLSAARDRAKEAPPEKAPVEAAAAETVEEDNAEAIEEHNAEAVEEDATEAVQQPTATETPADHP